MSVGGGSSEYVLEGRVESSGVDEFASQMGGAGDAVMGFKEKVGIAGGALAALSGGALAAGVSAAADFEEAMIGVEKVTTPETAEEMGSAIKDMASTVPLAQTELAAVAEQAGRLGVSGADNIKDFTRVTSEMAVSTDLAAEEAADSFARMSTLMQEPVENVRSIGDAINALSNNMATSASEITDAATRSSGALTNMGASSEEVLALNATMNTVSSSARIAGTQLRRMSQEMMNPKKVGKLANALGMTADEFKTMRKESPVELIRTMAERMNEGGESANGLRKALSTTSRQALASLGQNLDGLNTALETSKTQFEEGGSLADEFGTAVQSFHSQVQLAKNVLTNIAITIGNVLLPPLTTLLQRVTGGLEVFQNWNEQMGGVPATIGLITTTVLGATAAIGAFVGGPLTLLPALLTGAGAAAMGFDTDLKTVLSTVDNLGARLVTALGSAFEWLKSEGIPRAQTAFQNLVDGALAGFEMLSVWLPPRIRWAIEAGEQWLREEGLPLLRDGLSWLAQQALNGWAFTRENVVPPIRDGLGMAWTWLRESAPGLAKGAIGAVVDAATGAWEFTREDVVPAVSSAIGNVDTWIRENGVGIAEDAFGWLSGKAAGAWDFATGEGDGSLVGAVSSAVSGVDTWIREDGVGIAEGAFSWLSTQASNAWAFATGDGGGGGLIGKTRSAIQGVDTWIREDGVGLAEGAFSWLSTQASNAWAFASGDGDGEGGLVGKTRSAIEGVDTWIRETGVPTAEGAVSYLSEQATAAWKFTKQDLLPTVKSGINGVWGWVRTDGKENAKSAFEFLSTQAENAFNLGGEGGEGGGGGGLRSKTEQAVRAMNQWVLNTAVPNAKTAFGRLADASSTAIGNLKIKQKISQGVNNAVSWVKNQGVSRFKQAFRNLGGAIGPALVGVQDHILESYKNGIPKIRTWLRNNGERIIKEGFKAIGRGIRWFILGIFAINGMISQAFVSGINGLRDWLADGGLEKLLNGMKDIASGIVTYLKEDAVSDLLGAAEFLFENSIEAAVEGLYEGLIGKSLIPDMFNDIASFIREFDLASAAYSLLNSVWREFTNFAGNIIGGGGSIINGLISDIDSYIRNDAKDDVVAAFEALGRGIEGAMESAAEWAVSGFNDMLPDSLSIPEVTIGGDSINLPSQTIAGKTIGGGSLEIPEATIGGQSFDIPQLNTGGFVEAPGFAFLDPGEMVTPAAEVDRSQTTPGGQSTTGTDHRAIADGVARALGDAAIELDTDEETLKEHGIEGARIVFREKESSIDRGVVDRTQMTGGTR